MAERSDRRAEASFRGAPVWRDFWRARYALWASLLVVVLASAALHDLIAESLLGKLIWLLGVLLVLRYPLGYLFGFRCPRCHGVYLATGKLRDFLGLGRILWSSRCGVCSLPARETQELGPPSSGPIRESGPIA